MSDDKGSPTILLVNDLPDQLEVTAFLLKREGYRVIGALNGEEAFHLAQFDPPDLIVSDVAMPVMDGIELCRRIRATSHLAPTPIILLSAIRKDVPSMVEALQVGADDYVEAPYDPRFLLAKVRLLVEKNRAEKALQASRERYKSLFEYNPDAVYSFDLEGRFVEVNPACHKLSGYTREELIGSSFTTLIVPEELPQTVQRFRQAAEGEPQNYETAIYHKDGRRIELNVTNMPIIVDGQIVGVFGIAKDLTEQKRVQRALRESEARYRLLFESNPLPMWVYDLETLAFLDVNEAAIRHYGYSREEFLSMTIQDIRPREDLSTLMNRVKHIADSDQRYHRSGVWRHRKKDGTIIEVEIISHILELNGRRSKLVLANDVTEKRRAEEALRRQALVFDTIYDGVIVTDLQGRITDWNPAAERIFGYAKAEVLGQDSSLLYSAEISEQIDAEIRETVLTEGRWEGEIAFKRKDGTTGTADSIFVLQRDGQGNPLSIVGVNRDITPRKQLEDQLRQAQKMEAVGRLAGGVAHDFNNLLTAIIGYADLALRRVREDESLRRQIAEIKKSAERAANLTRQLLAFSRKQIIQPKPLNLNEVVEDMGKMLQRLLTENIELRLELYPDLWPTKVDPSQIEQVIVNLAVNARDAMPNGGLLTIRTANIETEESLLRHHPFIAPGKYVLLEVADTGCGMDEEVQRHIFEPFFTTKEPGKGTGLGLSTVYGIVKQSGGYVTVHSRPGEGAIFRIYLPQVIAEAASHRKRQSSTPAPQGYGNETILLVEDEESVRRMARATLEEFGYVVLEASNPRQALRICREHRGTIDLMLTDIVMPQMSGHELSLQAKALRPRMRILFTSGYMDDENLRRDLLSEDKPFLEKPFAPDALVRKVRETLDAPRPA
ncbi:PAS domain S-box protein [Pyrinomonas methylaliphatogenes]|uniref:histidine kinase n=1 Tax=Pyrinomonas methylaliphatogenes TaxID=454194 RepID=A0A0B6WXL0_9BACT|nr:PAS domain S-box protein [Pyrinomonas methylaliphatogenes]MBX5479246.1 PAS domain S-box protein [Pyrinomonas methylaliphatogenes]CDM65019.1 PAS domain S-box [Pyrinomonas methylaliphatogenes]